MQFKGIYLVVKRNQSEPYVEWTSKNNTSKTVTRFEVKFKLRTNLEGLRGTGGYIGYNFPEPILPHATYSNLESPIKPLPDEIQKIFDARKKSIDMKFLMVFRMVKKVAFSDGTVYENPRDLFDEF